VATHSYRNRTQIKIIFDQTKTKLRPPQGMILNFKFMTLRIPKIDSFELFTGTPGIFDKKFSRNTIVLSLGYEC
jgi:hypothetical protein